MPTCLRSLLPVLLLALDAQAQVPLETFCGSTAMHVMHQSASENNIYEHALFEEAIYRQLNDEAGQFRAIHTIPVVVHIIHNNGAENIADAQVLDGIQHLNDAFSNVGFYDPSTGVDVEIRFCLAEQDPDGNFSTGITRTVSPLTNMTMETQDLALKALIQWDPLSYMNIWLVNGINSVSIGPGVAGYAFFPSSHGNPEDGIVNEAALFGSSPDLSKVHIHEVGHYLGLYHTFEGGCVNNDCQLNGDRVCDTPPDASTAAVNCGSAVNTCATDDDDLSPNNPFRPTSLGGLGDQNDQYINYMDYGLQTCQSMFSQGQKDRMIASLTGARASLLQSFGCLSICTTPITATFTSSATSVTAGTVVNFGNTSSEANDFEWLIDGVPFSTTNNSSYPFNTQGTYEVTLICGNGDPSCEASVSMTVDVTCPVVASFSAVNDTIAPGGTADFINGSSGATDQSWYVNGVLQATTIDYSSVFGSPGLYFIQLVTGNGICTDSTGQWLWVANFCPGFSAGADQVICSDDTAQLDGSSLQSPFNWSGGTGTFLPSSSVLAPQYVPSLAEIAAGQASLTLSSEGSGIGNTICGPGFNLMSYDHNGNDTMFFVNPVSGDHCGYQDNDGEDWTGMGYCEAENRVYAFGGIAGTLGLFRLEFNTGVATLVVNYVTQRFFAAEYDNQNGILYVIGSPFNGTNMPQTLYRVNTVTGALTSIGLLGLTIPSLSIFYAQGDGINGLAHDPTVNTLYGISDNADLYNISIVNGVATLIGNCGVPNLRGLTYDYNNHVLYAIDKMGNVFVLDKTNGALITSIPASIVVNVVTSLTYISDGLPACMDSVIVDIRHAAVDLGPDTLVCPNADVLLQPMGTTGSYEWNDMSTDSTLTVTAADTYWVTVTDSMGCHASDTVVVDAYNLPLPAVDLGPDTSVCPGAVIDLHAGGPFQTIRWQDFSNSESFTAWSAGRYWVTVGDVCGSVASDTILISYLSGSFDPFPDSLIICEDSILTLNAGSGYLSYIWHDATSDSILVATESGRYSVQVSDDAGCSWSDVMELIKVSCDSLCQPTMPTVFTPNGDGINDMFRPIYGWHCPPLQWTIYNRWGLPIFTAETINEQWNGSAKNGLPAPTGVYYVIMRSSSGDFHGALQLLR